MSETALHKTVREELLALEVVRTRLVVAVSGGPDSVALCRIVVDLSGELGLEPAVGHVNHGLRQPAGDEDEAFVRSLARSLGVPCMVRHLDPKLRDAADRYQTLEEWAREARYNALVDIAREFKAGFIATGHTADDQAETVLLRIVRGTGLAGLTGIPVRRRVTPDVEVVRPALRLRRSSIVEWLQSVGQEFRTDAMNLDPAFTRNRIRHEVLPLLRDINPRVEDAICRLSTVAGEVVALLEPLTVELRQRAVLYSGPGKVILSAPALQRAPAILVRELLRHLWSEQNWPQQNMGFEEWFRVQELAYADEGTVDLPGQIRARRFGGTLVIQSLSAADATQTASAQSSVSPD